MMVSDYKTLNNLSPWIYTNIKINEWKANKSEVTGLFTVKRQLIDMERMI